MFRRILHKAYAVLYRKAYEHGRAVGRKEGIQEVYNAFDVERVGLIAKFRGSEYRELVEGWQTSLDYADKIIRDRTGVKRNVNY